LVALFFLLYAVSRFFYPPSRTTVPVPRRWGAITVQAAISVIAGARVGLFTLVFMPEISAKARAEHDKGDAGLAEWKTWPRF
jgi:hypothetical protein